MGTLIRVLMTLLPPCKKHKDFMALADEVERVFNDMIPISVDRPQEEEKRSCIRKLDLGG